MGANDLSEFLRRIRVPRIVVGMAGLRSLAECRPQTVGIILRKRTE
jgi:hypothetical protein